VESCSSTQHPLFRLPDDISGNIADTDGGGIYIQGFSKMNITSTTLSRNTATGGGGGGMSIQSPEESTISNCTFTENNALQGGGMFIFGKLHVASSSFVRNNATFGGAISLLVPVQSAKRADVKPASVIDSVTFTGNFAEVGGAVTSKGPDGSLLLITGATFNGNSAKNTGGALSTGGDSQITKSSFSSNDAPNGNAVSMGTDALTHPTVTVDSSVKLSGGQKVFAPNGAIVGIDANSVTCPPTYVTNSTSKKDVTCVPQSNIVVIPDKTSPGVIAGSVIGSLLGIALLALVGVIVYRRWAKKKHSREFEANLRNLNLSNVRTTVIDYNEIEGKKWIGQGAFGVVYRARWREANVAVKQLLSQGVSPDQLREFVEEMNLLQNLRSHPNVVVFLGTCIPPQPFSLVTEFCEGGSLDGWLKTNRATIDWAVQLRMIRGIAKGMFHLHSENIIHRDLAARNVLLSSSLEPKISDFGMSREQQEAGQVSKTNSNVGPIKWMAPESIRFQTYSVKSDVWSFGVTIWEIMHLEEPFADKSLLEVAVGVTTSNLRLPIQGVRSEPAQLMEACWKNDPEKRPTFQEIITLIAHQFGEDHPSQYSGTEQDSHEQEYEEGNDVYQPMLKKGEYNMSSVKRLGQRL